jgi:methionyl aminopeptidase
MSYVDAALAPQRKTGQIKLHGPGAFAGMRKAGQLVAECLDMLTDEVKPGVTTDWIDRLVFEFAMDHGATPATLMYRGYRKSTCTSVNHVVCHGIPGEKPLKDGDIVNVDVTLILDGWHGDSSRMFAVGAIPRRAERLIEVTYDAMMRGIAVIRPGATSGDIGHAIQSFVEGQHMSVVRDFCGHGLGRLFHDEPNIVHVGRAGEGIVLKPGMFFTVEPMINLGRPHVKVLSDGWTAVTRDRSLSAQFEHTVAVTETGVEIFTLSTRGLERPRPGDGAGG